MADTGFNAPAVTISEVDNSPKRRPIQEIVFPNGSITISGTTATITLALNSLSGVSLSLPATLHQHIEYDGANWVNVTDFSNDGHIYLKAGKKLYFDA